MAARKPDVSNKKKKRHMSKTSRVYKKSRVRKQGNRRTGPYWRQVQHLLVSESERQAMFTSLMQFLQGKNEKKKEQLYRLLQNQQPALFRKLLQGEDIAAPELSDTTVHEISQIIYERDVAPEIDQVPQPEVGDEIRQFNKLNMKLLSPERYQELSQLCKSCVPSLLLKNGKHRMASPTLPDGVQVMVYRYLRKHLTPGEQIDPATYDPDEMPLEDHMDWWEDIIFDYLKEQEEEKQRARGKI